MAQFLFSCAGSIQSVTISSISFFSLAQLPMFVKVNTLSFYLCVVNKQSFQNVCFLLDIPRANDVRVGTLVGEDKYGNKYYEDNKQFFGKCSILGYK